MKKLFYLLCAITLCTTPACSNDDDNAAEPAGTVGLNMGDEDHGKTLLEDSGIYIDKAQNFVTNSNVSLFALGRANGLGSAKINALSASVSRAAVETGQAFAVCRPAALMQFPSGAHALRIGDPNINYIKFYVQSSLKDKDGATTGAAIRYAMMQPNSYALPAYGSTIVDLAWSDYNESKGVVITLPTADFEYDLNDSDHNLSCVKKDKKLIIKRLTWNDGEYWLWIRVRESYTRVSIKLHS